MALKILEIVLSYFKRRPGEVLDLNNIIEVWNERGLDRAYLEPGLHYAEKKGWIEISNNGNSVKLTKMGYAKG